MITEKNIDIDYLLKLDEEVKKDERKFISLVKDRFIKSLLCKNIILLKKFLIYVLDFKLDPYNVELEILNNELLIDSYDERKKYTDFIVLLDNKYYIDIEFNTSNFEEVKYKNFLYICKMNSMIERKGSKTSKISERVVIQLNINADKNESTHYKNRNKDEVYKVIGENMSDILFKNFIIVLKPLDKYHKLYYNGDRSHETVMLEFFESDNYVKTYETLGYILTDEERKNAIEEMIKMNSNYVLYTDEEREIIDEMQMETNKKLYFDEGVEQGIEQGVEQGELNKQNEIIKNMIKNKFTLDQISLAINKPVEEVKGIVTVLKLI